MSERTIRVQPSELDSQANLISGTKENFKEAYEDIVAQSNYLTTTTWCGQDGEDFNNKVKEFKKDFDQMFNILDQYVKYLNKSAQAYRTAQDDVTSKIGTLETKVK